MREINEPKKAGRPQKWGERSISVRIPARYEDDVWKLINRKLKKDKKS